MRQLCGKFLMHFASAQLRRLRRNENRLKRFLRVRLEQVGELLAHFFCIDIADYNKGEIVGDVARFVILHYLFLGQLVIDFDLADDRKPIGVLDTRLKKGAAPPCDRDHPSPWQTRAGSLPAPSGTPPAAKSNSSSHPPKYRAR